MKKMKTVVCGLCLISMGIFGTVKAELPNNSQKIKTVQKVSDADQKINFVYESIDFGNEKPLSKEVFKMAYKGYLNLKEANKLSDHKEILSVADYSISANEKRLWVIDLNKRKVLFHSLVAHGQGTGEEFARDFSNKNESHQTSIGFFITENTYMGGNGYSLKMQGLDKSYNDNAYARAIVIHGAPYVSNEFIQANQRLGRSWGCPAVPTVLAKPIINTIKDKTCFFAYYPNEKYLASTQWLKNTPGVLDQKDFVKKDRVLLASNNLIEIEKKEAEPVIENVQIKPVYEGIQLNIPEGTM